MNKELKNIIEEFVEDVALDSFELAEDSSTKVKEIPVPDLSDKTLEEIEELIETIIFDDDADNVAETSYVRDVDFDFQLRKEVEYHVYAEYSDSILKLEGTAEYIYVIQCMDNFNWISEEEYDELKELPSITKAQYLGDEDEDEQEDDGEYDDEDEDESGYPDEFISEETGLLMHHIGKGVYSDDDGDNWDFC